MPETTSHIEEFAATYLLTHHTRTPRSVIVATVARYPDAPALSAAFAFVSLAAHLEDPVAALDRDGAAMAQDLYRCISAFVADIYAVTCLGATPATCGGVQAFWVTSDDSFFGTAAAQDAHAPDALGPESPRLPQHRGPRASGGPGSMPPGGPERRRPR